MGEQKAEPSVLHDHACPILTVIVWSQEEVGQLASYTEDMILTAQRRSEPRMCIGSLIHRIIQ